MAELSEWVVEIVATTEHQYTVLARTAEEAEVIAEDSFAEGDEGDVTSTSVDMVTAVTGSVDEDEEGTEIEFES